CYKLVELGIEALSDEESGWCKIDTSIILKLRGVFLEIFKSIFQFFELFFNKMEEKEEEKDLKLKKPNPLNEQEREQLIYASIRLIGIYLAEENDVLKPEFCEFLPFLISYKTIQLEDKKKIFPISFLL